MKRRQLAYGLATFVPGVNAIFGRGGGDSKSARYCYSVWLRHLVTLARDEHPRSVAELGPGDTLGVGIAALISGAERYHAFDVVRHANLDRDRAVFDELVALFERRAPIPDDAEFPEVRPRLASYVFPRELLPDAWLDRALARARLARLRDSLRDDAVVSYRTRWFERATDRVDLVWSQAVLEHVDDLDGAYRAMHAWLAPGGVVSHQIDFRCHGTTHAWNGHWGVSDLAWRLIRGKRSYLINREPLSTHLRLLAAQGFEVLRVVPCALPSEIDRRDLAPRFAHLGDDDLTTSSVLVQAVKPS